MRPVKRGILALVSHVWPCRISANTTGITEAFWKAALDIGNEFKVTEQLLYGGDNLMPARFKLNFTIGDKPFGLNIPNRVAASFAPKDLRDLVSVLKNKKGG